MTNLFDAKFTGAKISTMKYSIHLEAKFIVYRRSSSVCVCRRKRLVLGREVYIVSGIVIAGAICQFLAVYLLSDNFPVLVPEPPLQENCLLANTPRRIDSLHRLQQC